jgi:hypothetical protein
MDYIIRNELGYERLKTMTPHYLPFPSDFPVLAVGEWYDDPNGPEGIRYDYVYVVEIEYEGEKRYLIPQNDYFTLDSDDS